MNTWLHDSLIGAAATFLLAVYALARNPRDPTNLSFAGFMLTNTVLGLGTLLTFNSDSLQQAIFRGNCCRWSLIFMPAFFLSFCLYYSGVWPIWRRLIIFTSALISAAFTAASFGSWMVVEYVQHGPYLKPRYGQGYNVLVLYITGSFLLGMFILLRRYREKDPYQRNRIKLFILGLGFGCGIGVASYFLMHRIYYPLNTLAVLVAALFIALSFLKHRLLAVSSYIRVGVVYLIALALVLPVYAALIHTLFKVYGEVPPLVMFVTGAACLVLAFAFPGIRPRVIPLLAGLQPRGAVNSGRLTTAGRRLMGVGSVADVARELADVLDREIPASTSAVFLNDGRQPGLVRVVVIGDGAEETFAPSYSDGHPAMVWFLEQGSEVLVEDLRKIRLPEDQRAALQWMDNNQVQLVLPLVTTGGVRCLVALGGPRDGGIYEPGDIQALSLFGLTVGAALDAAHHFERLQIDRQMQHISHTVAGISHEFRNCLIPARTFLSLLPEKADDPEFTEGYRLVALKRLEQTFNLIRQLRDLNVDVTLNRAVQDLAVLVGDTVRALVPVAAAREVTIEFEDCERPVLCSVDGDQISRALYNIVTNAVEHAEGRPVGVRVWLDGGGAPAPGDRVMVTVTNSAVIPDDELPRLFVPFFTSKEGQGTGLGLPLTRRIVHAHGGTVAVRSGPPDGTVFSLRLPLAP